MTNRCRDRRRGSSMAEIRLRGSTFKRAGEGEPAEVLHELKRQGRVSGYSVTEQRVGLGTIQIIRLADELEGRFLLAHLEGVLVMRRTEGAIGIPAALKDVWLQQRRLEDGHED